MKFHVTVFFYAFYAVTNDLSWEGCAGKSTMKIADMPRLSKTKRNSIESKCWLKMSANKANKSLYDFANKIL